MRKSIDTKMRAIFALLFFCVLFFLMLPLPVCLGATEKTEIITGNLYEFEEDNKYEFSNMTSNKCTTTDFGCLKITGNMKSISAKNGINAFEVVDGNVEFDYSLGAKYLGNDKDAWYLIEDKSKKVDLETLENNILKGAIILQTSLDGSSWVTDKVLTDVADDTEYVSNIYTSKDIQQVNGCYYRVIVVYSLERVTGTSTFLFIDVDDKEIMKCAEVYQFYLINSSEAVSNGTSPSATPRKELGEVVNAGKDTGFVNKDALESDDPHYGWTLGTFFVNGYTRETKDVFSGNPVFLKNVGDRVTLWFNLKEDINNLNGNADLKINEDKNGYDLYFQTEKTNMRHGTLIIRYTDYEGGKHDPIIYTDYLAANAKTGANTKVELFEEGDYEVALDYEIVNTSGFDTYTNYRIFIEFSIRNGNCMVYPFDIASGAELQDNAITENGFKLDMAKSRYLTIDVTKTVLINGANGRVEDIRFNRPAKDGDYYKDEGIYTFNVHNLYTDEHTVKTIYVGTDLFLRAMSVNHLSVGDLENLLLEGYTIGIDGELIEPTVAEEDEKSVIDDVNDENDEKTGDVSGTVNETIFEDAEGINEFDDACSEEKRSDISVSNEVTSDENMLKERSDSSSIVATIFAAIVSILLVSGIVIVVIKKGKKRKQALLIEDGDLFTKDTEEKE